MKLFQIWSEGYSATGEHGHAFKAGEYEADSFDDAVAQYIKDKPSLASYYKKDHRGHSIWACRLFDNEADARKYFG